MLQSVVMFMDPFALFLSNNYSTLKVRALCLLMHSFVIGLGQIYARVILKVESTHTSHH